MSDDNKPEFGQMNANWRLLVRLDPAYFTKDEGTELRPALQTHLGMLCPHAVITVEWADARRTLPCGVWADLAPFGEYSLDVTAWLQREVEAFVVARSKCTLPEVYTTSMQQCGRWMPGPKG